MLHTQSTVQKQKDRVHRHTTHTTLLGMGHANGFPVKSSQHLAKLGVGTGATSGVAQLLAP